MGRLRLGVISVLSAALACCSPVAPGRTDAGSGPDGPMEPPWEPTSQVDPFAGNCSPTCVRGTFCTSRGRCASTGPTACPGPCPGTEACGPWRPGCTSRACAVPGPWPREVQKVITLEVLPATEGCDLDGDGDVDNGFGLLLPLLPALQSQLTNAVQTARAVAVLELSDGGTSAWFGSIDATQLRCNPASPDAVCAYTASPYSFDLAGGGAGCGAWWRWEPGSGELDGGVLALSSELTEVLVPLEDTALLLRVARPTVRALARVGGGKLEGLREGRLCAALLPGQLRLAMGALPADTVSALGGMAQVGTLFDALVHPDVDLDGDGRAEHVSVAFRFTSARALATGLTPGP